LWKNKSRQTNMSRSCKTQVAKRCVKWIDIDQNTIYYELILFDLA